MDTTALPPPLPHHYARRAGQYLIFLGLLNFSAALAGLFFHDHLKIDLTIPLLIWAGRGILRHRESFRKWVCRVAVGIAALCLLHVVCYGLFGPHGQRIGFFALEFSDLPYWIVALHGISLCALVLPPAYWLTRPQVRELFSPEGDPEALPQGVTRKSLWTMTLIVFALMFPSEFGHWLIKRELTRKNPNATMPLLQSLWRDDSSHTINTAQGLWSVEYGYRGNRLAYAVFQGSTGKEQSVENLVMRSGIRPNVTVTLRRPDGREEPHPGKVTLMQYLDGKYSERDFSVSYAEFEAFLASNPNRYTIEALVDHVTAYRARH